MMLQRHYGWKKPAWGRGFSDPVYQAPRRPRLPQSVDLRPGMPTVFDQGQLGSCTANAVAGALFYDEDVQRLTGAFMPSRLFSYYNSRQLEGDVSEDVGASIADAVKAVVQWGFCPESMWPYDVGLFAVKPPDAAYTSAKLDLVTDYAAVQQSVDQITGALAAGHPVLYGFNVYQGYENVGSNGLVPLPSGPILGGHANLLCGYDLARQLYLTRNSWGMGWGMSGYAWMPFSFIHVGNEASDFWVINTVPGAAPPPPPPVPPPPTPTSLFSLAFSRPVAKGKTVSFAAPVAIPVGRFDVVPHGTHAAEAMTW